MTQPIPDSSANSTSTAFDRDILDALPDPVLAFDAQNVLRVANTAARTLLNLAPGLIGQPLKDALPAELYTAILKTLADEDAEWHTDDNQTFYTLHLKSIANDANSARSSVVGSMRVLILQDVTRFKVLHQNYEDFVSTVLHDLRTPLTSMRGFADMLSMVGPVNEVQKQYVGKVMGGISQIASLIENSLDAGRLDPVTGSYKLLRESSHIDVIVEEVVAAQKNEAEHKHQSIIVDTTPELPPVFLDETMVRRALNNLVDNAIKYTPEGGTITVRAYIRDSVAYLSVQDSGSGISAEEQKAVFDRFKRLSHPEHARVKGSGLGLFVVKNVAQWHGGDAVVESVIGQGSTFIMQLPIVAPPAKNKSPFSVTNGTSPT